MFGLLLAVEGKRGRRASSLPLGQKEASSPSSSSVLQQLGSLSSPQRKLEGEKKTKAKKTVMITRAKVERKRSLPTPPVSSVATTPAALIKRGANSPQGKGSSKKQQMIASLTSSGQFPPPDRAGAEEEEDAFGRGNGSSPPVVVRSVVVYVGKARA